MNDNQRADIQRQLDKKLQHAMNYGAGPYSLLKTTPYNNLPEPLKAYISQQHLHTPLNYPELGLFFQQPAGTQQIANLENLKLVKYCKQLRYVPNRDMRWSYSLFEISYRKVTLYPPLYRLRYMHLTTGDLLFPENAIFATVDDFGDLIPVPSNPAMFAIFSDQENYEDF